MEMAVSPEQSRLVIAKQMMTTASQDQQITRKSHEEGYDYSFEGNFCRRLWLHFLHG